MSDYKWKAIENIAWAVAFGSAMVACSAFSAKAADVSFCVDSQLAALSKLMEEHGEQPRVVYLDDGVIKTLTASPDGMTWTLLMTEPSTQKTCTMRDGEKIIFIETEGETL